MDKVEFIKELVGHSGCKLHLLKCGDTLLVRKFSPSDSYDSRLEKQRRKQASYLSDSFKVPTVLESGKENGRFYFDMEFLRGKTLAEHFNTLSTSSIESIIDRIYAAIRPNSVGADDSQKKVFADKISDLKRNLSTDKIAMRAISKLEKFDWTKVEPSPCHGDMTLENIIVSDEDFYLIDFLDSFYDSWMMDAAKLLQDLELKWSYRNEPANFERDLRLSIARSFLLDRLCSDARAQDCVSTVYNLLLLNVLRIYPYCKDSRTKLFLDKSVKSLITRINSLKKNKNIRQ